jgi:hypothetical protein
MKLMSWNNKLIIYTMNLFWKILQAWCRWWDEYVSGNVYGLAKWGNYTHKIRLELLMFNNK